MNREYVNILYRGICLSAGVSAVFHMALFYYYSGFSGRLSAFGALKNPIMAASCYSVAVLVIFFSYLVQKDISLPRKVKYILAMIISVGFVVLTQSRGPLLALALALILCSALVRPKYALWVIGGFVIPLTAIYANGLVDFSALFARADSYRLTIWKQSWDLFVRHPWGGYGFRGERPDIVITDSIAASHSHNLFLSTMLDGGAVALVLLVAVIGLATYWALRNYRERGDVTLLALIAFAVLGNLTDGKTPIVSPNYQWLCFWLPIGLAAAYELASSQQKLPGPGTDAQVSNRILA
jgi:O-antigen ligase